MGWGDADEKLGSGIGTLAESAATLVDILASSLKKGLYLGEKGFDWIGEKIGNLYEKITDKGPPIPYPGAETVKDKFGDHGFFYYSELGYGKLYNEALAKVAPITGGLDKLRKIKDDSLQAITDNAKIISDESDTKSDYEKLRDRTTSTDFGKDYDDFDKRFIAPSDKSIAEASARLQKAKADREMAPPEYAIYTGGVRMSMDTTIRRMETLKAEVDKEVNDSKEQYEKAKEAREKKEKDIEKTIQKLTTEIDDLKTAIKKEEDKGFWERDGNKISELKKRIRKLENGNTKNGDDVDGIAVWKRRKALYDANREKIKAIFEANEAARAAGKPLPPVASAPAPTPPPDPTSGFRGRSSGFPGGRKDGFRS